MDFLKSSNNAIEGDTSIVKVPKKRGRKPKLNPEQNISEISLNASTSAIEEVEDEEVARHRGKETMTDSSCGINNKEPRKRGRPPKEKPGRLESDTSSQNMKRRKSSKLHSDLNNVSSQGDISDMESSATSELLDTDVIMINENKLHNSLPKNKKSRRKCLENLPQKSSACEENQSDGFESDNYSDNSEDDVSYSQRIKRNKIDYGEGCSDNSDAERTSGNSNNLMKRKSGRPYFQNNHKKNDKVVCGVCKKEMLYSKYKNHHAVFKHYMLTWLEGEECPVDMTDQKEIEARLWYCKKMLRKVPFRCPVCNLPKLSAVGYYSHILFCGKNDEEKESLLVTCELCGAKMMPSSYKPHMYIKHSNKSKEASLKEDVDQSVIVRGPRAAAARAVKVIQKSQANDEDGEEPHSRASSVDGESNLARLYAKPSKTVPPQEYRRWKMELSSNNIVVCTREGCNFTATSTAYFRKHYLACPFRPPQLYKCRCCDFTSTTEESMLGHIEAHRDLNFEQHQTSDEESSSGECEDEHKPSTSKATYSGSIQLFKFLQLARQGKQSRYLTSRKRYYAPAIKWTYELRQKMHAKEPLYQEVTCQPLPSETTTHLPELSESIRFQGKTGVWQNLQRFQGCLLDGVPVLFAGGPVWATAWAPVPYPEEHQYLAVAPVTNVELTHKMSSLYNYPGVIQIWSLGALNNSVGEVSCPRMVMGIAQKRGPVWGLSWCPAGAYSQDRLGLVAAACGDGGVVVYAVPRIAYSTSEPNVKCSPVKPAWELKLGCEMMAQCTCVEWHSAAPHSIIAGGFANGMVALWDITTDSALLRSGSAILPFKVIEAHHSAVTAVKLSCQNKNVLMSASLDRTTKFWDVEDTGAPVSYLRKACVTDAVLTNNWVMSISAYDDVYSINSTHVSGCNYRDFCSSANVNLAMQPGTVWALSFNDWLNGCAYASEMGKVNAFFRQQLLVTEDSKKISKTAFREDMVTCSTLSLKDGSSITSGFGSKYKDCASSVGLKFDIGGQSTKGRGTKSQACSSDNMDSFPIRSFNSVSWNQNMGSFVWLAAGMQCGLVVVPRVSNLPPMVDLASLDQTQDNL